MKRVLLIDPNRMTREHLGLQCLGRDVGVVLAENLAEGVRSLLSGSSVHLMNPDYSEMGASYGVNMGAEAVVFWAQELGRPR